MMVLNRPTTQSTTWTINELSTRQNDNEIYLDLAFQSSERWSAAAALAYLRSVFSGFTPNPIILAHVESCMKYCEERLGKDSDDYKYFASLHTNNVKYISVDGNNRTRAIMKFFNNLLKLKEGTSYRISGAPILEFSNYTPTNTISFKGMPEKLKEYVREIKVPVFLVNEATRQELHDMFIAVNNGVSLNPQEKRNAIVCKVADEIRALAKKYDKMLRLYFSKGNCQRRIHEDFLVTALVHVTHGFTNNIALEDKNKAYSDSSPETKKLGRLKEVLKDMDSLIQYEAKTGSGRGIRSKASLFDMVMLVDYLHNQNISIIDDSKFFEWFTEHNNALRDDTKTIVVPDPIDPRTFYGAQRANDKPFREARLAQMVARLDFLSDGVLSVPKDKKRFGDGRDRIHCWTRQEHRCPLSGDNIPWVEVLDGNKTHLDHIVPHSKGGQTTRDNLQLVKKSANLLKSDN